MPDGELSWVILERRHLLQRRGETVAYLEPVDGGWRAVCNVEPYQLAFETLEEGQAWVSTVVRLN